MERTGGGKEEVDPVIGILIPRNVFQSRQNKLQLQASTGCKEAWCHPIPSVQQISARSQEHSTGKCCIYGYTKEQEILGDSAALYLPTQQIWKREMN